MPSISAVGKRRPTSTTSDPAVDLEDRHVLADLPQSAEREDAQVGAHAAAPARPWRSSAPRTSAVRSLVGLDASAAAAAPSTGRSARSAFLIGIGLCQPSRLVDVLQAGVDLGAVIGLVDHPAHLVADDVAGDQDAARAAQVERAREACCRCRRRASRPSISASASSLACLTPSMSSICASRASRSLGMSSAVRDGML